MAEQRKYSIQEIDEMRMLVRSLLYPKFPAMSSTGSGTFSSPSEENVERQLRTYMVNGTGPEELRAELQRLGKPLVTVGRD